MSLLNFDKTLLGNLEYSLQREMLSTNRSGGYMSTTIVCCNTRKYHGLVVGPIEGLGTDHNYVLLSSLDETIVQGGEAFNLAIHRFPGVFEPRGHKYITDFEYTPSPTITYMVGGVKLCKQLLWIHERAQLMVRYTLSEAASPIKLRLRPMLAFRDAHTVSQANMEANGRAYPVDGGVKCKLYDGFPWLNMQTDRGAEFIEAPDWYYKFEYPEEQRRGYPYQEDLLTPGYFELELAPGENVTVCCRVDEPCSPQGIAAEFDAELARRSDKNDFFSCLRHSARQFIARRGGRTEVIAGYPWFGSWGRDTFIALPGITLTQGGIESCEETIDTMVSEMRGGLFPNVGEAYNSVDAPLWFFWTLQQLAGEIGLNKTWKRYGKVMESILEAFTKSEEYIRVMDNGLVWASHPSRAMTWMDACVDGKPVTGRDGFQVEINALWYNALCFALELAEKCEDKAFIKKWEDRPARVKAAFIEKFWLQDEGYLADYVGDKGPNKFIRPNQIIACSLPYTILNEEQMRGVFETVKQHLLTPRGLRTLSPRNPLYQGRYEGDQPSRDRQYHQGTVWPWLLEHYAAAGFRLYGEKFQETARELIAGFEEDINSYGIGSVAEIYDGDPPHNQRGAISQAWSVGAVLRIKEMIGE